MDLLECVIDRGHGVGDFLDIFDAGGTELIGLFPGQHVDERRLGAFDLRRQQGLLADEGIDEPVAGGTTPASVVWPGLRPRRTTSKGRQVV